MTNNLEYLEKRKLQLKNQQEEIDRQIEAAKAQKEQDREMEVIGLFGRINSLIKTSSSSFSPASIGDIKEYRGQLNSAEPYGQTIDVEISGRYVEDEDPSEEAFPTSLDHIAKMKGHTWSAPTLVVSYLIPLDLIEDDEFFQAK